MSGKELFPKIEPYHTSRLKVSEVHTIFYEEVGNPGGRPALYLHGGPGIGILPSYRRFFDPSSYRVVLPDQRGAGRSTPHAEISENTTWELVEDLERLRLHLEIESWIVMGGSWGSTLALCYAIKHPDRVAGLIIRGVWLVRPFEIAWLYEEGGASNVFPDEWERFQAPLDDTVTSGTLASYFKLLTGKDEAAKMRAARAWSRWETAMATLIPDPSAIEQTTKDHSALSKARIECHFAYNKFFMESDNYILENAGTISHIPCRIVQGRHDVICPTISAWQLHRALPKSELKIVADGCHSPMDRGMAAEILQASKEFHSL